MKYTTEVLVKLAETYTLDEIIELAGLDKETVLQVLFDNDLLDDLPDEVEPL